MNIKTVRAYAKLIPLKKPYTIARETIYTAEIIFLEIHLSNGICGRGAANPDPEVIGETPLQTLRNLHSDEVQSGLAEKDIREFHALIGNFRKIYQQFPATMAAIDMALHDAFGKWIGLPIVDFYGRHHSKMLTSVTIGIKDVTATLQEAREYKSQGFKVLKVKTGIDTEEDAERIIRLYETFGDYFTIRVDANEGYTTENLRYFLNKTAFLPLELTEQPFSPRMNMELLEFPGAIRNKLAADESLKDAKTALELAQDGLFGIFNIKLMKCGGITAAFEIANIARQADIALFWGCNDESSISISAALHAAFACSHTRYLDLDGSFDLLEDSDHSGFILEDGFLSILSRPGIS
ncbi:dipeptide epimerase [Dyadobacter sediminis]|uniref:Dipeptide epimerase n=1 Tax=Dyadobacter sediminis TaxID=1493691 RepID=A0A5R9KJ10_9BACT|nr:dipeptide epimerase [Dyadobacter sediminis]TLU96109.1 dipeptide epimerase [Dyadobacter sediminis]GGB79332.1 dipeptide epimerase [Dyadobacter sediminis]